MSELSCGTRFIGRNETLDLIRYSWTVCLILEGCCRRSLAMVIGRTALKRVHDVQMYSEPVCIQRAQCAVRPITARYT